MRVECDQTATALICEVIGNLEHLTVGAFREAVTQFPARSRVIFDLSAVPFVDAAGLGALIGAARRVRQKGGDVVICSARPSVARALELANLSQVIALAPGVTEARAQLWPAA